MSVSFFTSILTKKMHEKKNGTTLSPMVLRKAVRLTAEGRNIILDRYSLLADNTSYSKEFADVLKKIFGYLPDNGPLAGAIL